MAETVSRESGIGGTDIAAIVGVSPYKTRWDVYADKRGLAEPVEVTTRMKVGILQQPTVVRLYEEETGDIVAWSDETIRHPKEEWIVGTPDGFIAHEPGPGELLFKKDGSRRLIVELEAPGFEAKTAGLDQAWRWGENQDDIPEEYIIQCQWYMVLTGRKRWVVAALIGGDRFRFHVLDADEEFQAMLVREGERFWKEYVARGKQPDFDHGRSARAYIKRLFPTASKTVREAGAVELEAMRELAGVNRELSYLDKRKATLVTRIESMIGSDYAIESREEGLKAIWYGQKESTYQVTRPAGRVFRLYDKRRGNDDDGGY